MPGQTAKYGMEAIAKPQKGETIFVSSASFVLVFALRSPPTPGTDPSYDPYLHVAEPSVKWSSVSHIELAAKSLRVLEVMKKSRS